MENTAIVKQTQTIVFTCVRACVYGYFYAIQQLMIYIFTLHLDFISAKCLPDRTATLNNAKHVDNTRLIQLR